MSLPKVGKGMEKTFLGIQEKRHLQEHLGARRCFVLFLPETVPPKHFLWFHLTAFYTITTLTSIQQCKTNRASAGTAKSGFEAGRCSRESELKRNRGRFPQRDAQTPAEGAHGRLSPRHPYLCAL